MISCGTLPTWLNDSIAGPKSASAASGSPSEVCRRAASPPDEALEESDAVFA